MALFQEVVVVIAKAGDQRALGRPHRGAVGAKQRQNLVKALGLAQIAQAQGAGIGGEMAVGVDESGHQGPALQIHPPGMGAQRGQLVRPAQA